MTSEPTSNRMDEVADLTTSLSNAILHAHMMGRGVTDEQVHALAKAARLFHDRGEAWPPILEQVLHELAREPDAENDADQSVDDPIQVEAPVAEGQRGDEKGVKRFLSALKRKRD
ncbi:hypothetical protein [Methylobacterium sp. C25]|uniref:hypothetical protein n=1 Tax=Methylobacterium sp. C25 TaxID=2721622 RepID=UPI001F34C5A6|nr:hypothetical protein [Methylobacterium sp. C25]